MSCVNKLAHSPKAFFFLYTIFMSIFLRINNSHKQQKEKIDKLDIIKIKNLHVSKDNIKKVEG